MNKLLTGPQSPSEPNADSGNAIVRAQKLLDEANPDPWEMLEITEELIGVSPILPGEKKSLVMSLRNSGEMEILFRLTEKIKEVADLQEDEQLQKTLLDQVDNIDEVLKVVANAIAASRNKYHNTITMSNNSFNDDADRFRKGA